MLSLDRRKTEPELYEDYDNPVPDLDCTMEVSGLLMSQLTLTAVRKKSFFSD